MYSTWGRGGNWGWQKRGFVNPEAVAYVAAMSAQPDYTRRALIDTFFSNLKAGPLFGTNSLLWLDAFGFTAAHDQQAANLDLLRPTLPLIPSGNPLWTADRGYTGDAVDDDIEIPFNPTTATGKYSQNSACIGVGTLNASGNNSNVMGVSGTVTALITPSNGTDVVYRVNNTSGSGTNPNTNKKGRFLTRRTTGSATSVFRNAATIGTTTISSTGLPNANFHLLRLLSNQQVSHWFIGAAPPSANAIADLDATIAAYETAVGIT